jgi:hypothetical protein
MSMGGEENIEEIEEIYVLHLRRARLKPNTCLLSRHLNEIPSLLGQFRKAGYGGIR